MRPSPASLGFYVVAYASSPLAQKKALAGKGGEGNKQEEEDRGGVEVLRSATVRAATALTLALALALALTLTLTLTLTPTLALALTLTLTLTRPASWLCSGAPTTCAWWLRSRRRPYPYPYPYPYPHPHPYP